MGSKKSEKLRREFVKTVFLAREFVKIENFVREFVNRPPYGGASFKDARDVTWTPNLDDYTFL